MTKLLTLQVARGAAANLVVLSHLAAVDAKYTGGQLSSFLQYGVAGVDLFFVLSGFVMVAIAGNRVGAGAFLWRRAARIYPTYWLITLVVLFVSLVSPAVVNSSIAAPISIWRSFLLVPQETPPLLAVGWTLVHEAYFYLIFAVILLCRLPIVTALLLWGLSIFAVMLTVDANSSPTLRLLTSPLTAEFMMGALIGVMYQRGVAGGALIFGLSGLALFATNIFWTAPRISLASSQYLDALRVLLFGVPAGLILYSLAAWELRSSPRPPPLLVALGDWSYATYLVHVLVLSALGRVLAGQASPGIDAVYVLFVVGMVTVNIAGAAVHSLFERPVLSLIQKLGRSQAQDLRRLTPELDTVIGRRASLIAPRRGWRNW